MASILNIKYDIAWKLVFFFNIKCICIEKRLEKDLLHFKNVCFVFMCHHFLIFITIMSLKKQKWSSPLSLDLQEGQVVATIFWTNNK